MKKYTNPKNGFFLIAGPCAVESEKVCMEVAGKVSALCDKYGIHYVFKASYKKANRTKSSSFKGIGDEKALRILEKVKTTFHIPITTDVHETNEVDAVAEVVDIIQIPAFLSRQTELLEKAGHLGKIINIKKGQFMTVDNLKDAVYKVWSTKNMKTMITERGNCFGYDNTIVDFRNLIDLAKLTIPSIFDATHSVGRLYTFEMAKAALSIGTQGIFIETHPDPDSALSDGSRMLKLDKIEKFIKYLL